MRTKRLDLYWRRHQSSSSKSHGMTLIELMITMAIVAILAAVAYPSYTNQTRRARRAEAKQVLLQIQVAQERFFLQNNRYGTIAELGPGQLGLTLTGGNFVTTSNFYRVSLTALTATTFTAQAAASGSQVNDTACATYTADQTGNRTPAGDCWNR